MDFCLDEGSNPSTSAYPVLYYWYMNELNFTISSAEDAIKLMEQLPTNQITVSKDAFDPSFWDLSTRKLGDFLQKLTNYRIKLDL